MPRVTPGGIWLYRLCAPGAILFQNAREVKRDYANVRQKATDCLRFWPDCQLWNATCDQYESGPGNLFDWLRSSEPLCFGWNWELHLECRVWYASSRREYRVCS